MRVSPQKTVHKKIQQDGFRGYRSFRHNFYFAL